MTKLAALEIGEFSTGLIFDARNTPPIPGIFVVDENYGPLLRVSYPHDPFKSEPDQYAHLERWSEGIDMPSTLEFLGTAGVATFHECVVIRKVHNFAGVTEVTLRPKALIYGSAATGVDGPLAVTRLESRITGLETWLRQRAVRVINESLGEQEGRQTTFESRRTYPVELELGNLRVTLSTRWAANMGSRRQGFTTNGHFITESDAPLELEEHLNVHRRFRALLILSSGKAANYEGHSVGLSHSADRPTTNKLVHFSTYQQTAPPPTKNSFTAEHISSIQNADTDKLRSWLKGENRYYEASLPAADLLRRDKFSAIDRVIYMGIVTEGLGQELSAVAEEEMTYSHNNKPTHTTFVLRCISHSLIDMSANPFKAVSLAQAIAKNYNKTKHFQPAVTPDPSVSGILGRFMAVVLRHVAVRMALIGEGSSETSLDSSIDTHRAIERLRSVQLDDQNWPTFKVITEEIDTPPSAHEKNESASEGDKVQGNAESKTREDPRP